MLQKLTKAELVSDANITPLILEDDLVQLEFQSLNNPDEKYLVSMNEYELWRCDCPDYTYRGLNHDEGSYLCKHIMAVLNYLQNHDIGNMSEGLQ